MNRFVVLFALASLIVVAGCATSFTGSAHIEGGRAECEQKCAGQGLALSGMVYMGEYSSACVCEVPGRATASRSLNNASAAIAGGAAGVVMQARAANSSYAY